MPDVTATETVRWLCASERAVPSGHAWLTALERDWAGRCRFTKRRDDYLLGRLVAKRAIASALGLGDHPTRLACIEVRNQREGPERGAPEAFVEGSPAPLELSITDRGGWGVCAVRGPGARLGCDLELVEPRSAAFVDAYLTADEQARVRAAGDETTRQVLANLLWCAKESALKVLRTGLRRDTRSVEVKLDDDDAPEWRCLAVLDHESGAVIPGWWRRFGPFLLTVACDVEIPAPERLDASDDLAAATPTHDWMAAPRVARPD